MKMTKVNFVKSARKDYPDAGIAKGDSYYWWSFRFGGRRVSKTPPKPSQLTQSEFLSTMYSAQEQVEVMSASTVPELEEIVGDLRSLAEDIRSLGDNQADKLSNMPDNLQQAETGQLLESRVGACETIGQDLDEAADLVEEAVEEINTLKEPEAGREEVLDEADEAIRIEGALDALGNISWEFE